MNKSLGYGPIFVSIVSVYCGFVLYWFLSKQGKNMIINKHSKPGAFRYLEGEEAIKMGKKLMFFGKLGLIIMIICALLIIYNAYFKGNF